MSEKDSSTFQSAEKANISRVLSADKDKRRFGPVDKGPDYRKIEGGKEK